MVQGMKQLKIDDTFEYTDNMSEADVLIALQSKFKKNSRLQAAARSRGIPTYICKVETKKRSCSFSVFSCDTQQ